MHSDARNPYAYVPSRSNVEDLETWLGKLSDMEGGLGPIAVVGQGHWPLPWYLRTFDQVGYWAGPPAQVGEFKVVVAMYDQSDAVEALLQETHSPFPYGLRDGVPMVMFLNDEVFKNWLEAP